MAANDAVPVYIDPSRTMPASTGPPNSSGSWAGVAQEGVRQAGAAVERFQAQDRPPRPRASTLSIINAVCIVVLFISCALTVVILVTWHQMGTSDYERRQEERHEAIVARLTDLTNELATQRLEQHQESQARLEVLYQLIDTVAEHHAEAAKVGRRLERGRVAR